MSEDRIVHVVSCYGYAALMGINFGVWQHNFCAGLFAYILAVVLLQPWRKP